MTTSDRNGALHARDGKYTEKAAAAPGPGAALGYQRQDENDVNRQEDRDGQTLHEVLLARLRWEYGDDAPWEELGSLKRLERDVRLWFKDQGFPPGSNVDEHLSAVSDDSDPREVARALADHQKESWGMGYGSPDRCRCGAEIMPMPGEEEVSIRRDKAFAAHQAEMLTTPPGN